MANSERPLPKSAHPDSEILQHKGFTPAELQTQFSPLESKVIKNFYLSFKFSQGSEDTQRALQVLTASNYTKEELCANFGNSAGLDERIGPTIQKLRAPKTHYNFYAKNPKRDELIIKKKFYDQWRSQNNIFRHIMGERIDSPLSGILLKLIKKPRHILLTTTLDEMTQKDIHYLVNGRPSEMHRKGDPRESLVKKHVFDQETTGSKEFDDVFAEMREVATKVLCDNAAKTEEEAQLAINLGILFNKWEEAHQESNDTQTTN